MSKRKGVSADEKRSRMLELFYEKKSVFQLKELEKIAPKEKGIISNAVKDVLQKLVDDGLVDTDKIGTSVYFWAFPSKAVKIRKRKLEDLKIKSEETNKKLKETSENLITEGKGKENCSERNILLDKIMDLKIERDELIQKLQKFKENDPVAINNVRKNCDEVKNAGNRWTDNIFSIKSWCKNKFCMEDNVLDKQFGIPDNFDYIE